MARPASYGTILVSNATPTKICSPAPDRTALLFSVQGGDVYISPDPNVAVGHGLHLVDGQPPVEVCACHQGDWVSRDLWALASANNTPVYIIEGFEPLKAEG